MSGGPGVGGGDDGQTWWKSGEAGVKRSELASIHLALFIARTGPLERVPL